MTKVKNIADMQGCQYLVRNSTLKFLIDGKWQSTCPAGAKGIETKGRPGLVCHKVTDSGDTYCPHHMAVIAHDADRFRRAGLASAKSKAAKKDKDAALEASPLRAFNPEFRETKTVGYSDGR